MSKDLNQISRQISTLVSDASINTKLEVIVESLKEDSECFFVRSTDNNVHLECRANDKKEISHLRPGNNIVLRGLLKYDLKQNKIYLAVQYLYLSSEKEEYDNMFKIYHRLYSTLHNDKCEKYIQKLHRQNLPQSIENIAFIIFPDDNENLNQFLNMYQQKCTGNIFIYFLQREKVSTELSIVLEYFKKYHQIDLICILSNTLSNAQVCQFSSKENIKYILNRSKTPYIISIIPDQIKDQIMLPLTAMLSSRTETSHRCIELIERNQQQYRSRINQLIEQCHQQLNEKLETSRQKLFRYKMQIASLVDPKSLSIPTNTLADDLKKLLLDKLNQAKYQLLQFQSAIVSSIIDDQRSQKFFTMIIDSEKRLIHNEEIPGGESEINEKVNEIKQTVLSQNPHLQEYPDKKFQVQEKLDHLSAQISSLPKKIENKTLDNNSFDEPNKTNQDGNF